MFPSLGDCCRDGLPRVIFRAYRSEFAIIQRPFLRTCLGFDLLYDIAHFGSTTLHQKHDLLDSECDWMQPVIAISQGTSKVALGEHV